jgi:rubrerythrin
VIAFRVARFIAAKWNWYTCGACGVWFQARIEAERCPGCDAERDRIELADALAEFDQRFEQTQNR